MNQKIIFLDADGTILDAREGMTERTVQAIKNAMANGHLVFLCTGRSRAFIPDYVENLNLTGLITNCGAYIEYKGTVILDDEVSQELAHKTLRVLRETGMLPVLEGTGHMYYDKDEYTTEVDDFVDHITEAIGEKWRPIKGNENNLHFSKLSAKRVPGSDYERACEELKDDYDFIVHEGGKFGTTVEMIDKGFSKGGAIKQVCEMLHIDQKEAIAFGDSNNDLTMFDVAGVRVAMGDGAKVLKDRADYITASRKDEGIEQAFAYLGLL